MRARQLTERFSSEIDGTTTAEIHFFEGASDLPRCGSYGVRTV